MKKIIFLDFDGVLHREIEANFANLPLLEQYLHKMPEVEIVISSAWRETLSFTELKAIFSASLQHRICGVTPMLECGYNVGGRQREVEKFLADNNLDENNACWLALDDIEQFFDYGYKNLIVVNGNTGFTKKEGSMLLEWYNQVSFLDKLEKTKYKTYPEI